MKVVVGARRSDRLEALAAQIAGAAGEAAYARADVERRDDLSELINWAGERFGAVDVLVNNAGVMPISPLDDLHVEEWEEIINVNITGLAVTDTRVASADGYEVTFAVNYLSLA